MSVSNQSERPFNRDMIKSIAIFTMLLNHIAYVFLKSGTPAFEIMVDIGYFTAITMIWFMVEGYDYTKSKRKYALRLLIFAVISQIPFSMAFKGNETVEAAAFNMLFTLLACFGIIYVMKEKRRHQYQAWMILGLCFATCFSDWGLIAPVFTILFVNAGKDRKKQIRAWIVSIAFFGCITLGEGLNELSVVQNLIHTAACMAAMTLAGICVFFLYNGKRAKNGQRFFKWFFYLFYPVHLLVLGILKFVL